MQSAVPLKIQFLFVHAVLQRIIRLKTQIFCLDCFKIPFGANIQLCLYVHDLVNIVRIVHAVAS